MTENEIDKELQRLNKYEPFKEFMWDKYKVARETGKPIRTGQRWFHYIYEDDAAPLQPIQLIGYMLDYLYTVENNKVLLYMGTDIEDKFRYLVELIVKEEEK